MFDLRGIGTFAIKSAILIALVFAALYVYTHQSQVSADCAAPKQTVASSSSAMAAIDSQINAAREQTKQYDELMRRSTEVLKKQEEHVMRYEAVLQRWEKQTGLRK